MLGKKTVILVCALTLSACGGGGNNDRSDRRAVSSGPVAVGPISKACLNSDRKKRSKSLCSCIQAAADETLSRSEQRKSVAFYDNPHLAQQIRTSDRPQDEKFWDAYAKYGQRARQMCG